MSMEALAWRMEILLRRQQGDEVLERRREKWQISSATHPPIGHRGNWSCCSGTLAPTNQPRGPDVFQSRETHVYVPSCCACPCVYLYCEALPLGEALYNAAGVWSATCIVNLLLFYVPSLFRNVMATNELQEPPHRCASQSRRRCLNNLD